MLQLRDLPAGARIGISALVLVLGVGIAASLSHLYDHYQNRDERPGLTLDDLEGAYHGLDRPSLLLTTLEAGHPDQLDGEARRILTDWLRSDRVVESYDDLDLGDFAPAELIAAHCLECHSRKATTQDGIGERIPLDYFDDVKTLAFSQRIEPTPAAVLAASTHAHALSLASLSLIVSALAWGTAFPRRVVSFAIAMVGLGLLGDIGGWWLARELPAATGLVVGAGAVYNGGTGLILIGVLFDLWRPRRAGGGTENSEEEAPLRES